MRYALPLILVALVVVLLLHHAKGPARAAAEAGPALDKAKAAALQPQLRQVAAALEAYAGERGAFPQDLDDLVPFHLAAADLLVDPWGTRLRLEAGGAAGAVLVSAGPDCAFASADDTRRSL